jgi:SAM-dependent methyltransferase
LNDADMRATWDAAASTGHDEIYVGDPATAAAELDSLLSRLGADPRGGTCVEIGCGPGRMTGLLAARFDRVVAVDVSPVMLERAAREVDASNVEFRHVSGSRLDSVDDGVADVVVCYLVLQHLPGRSLVTGYLSEIGRVLAREGTAFVQLPVLSGIRGRAWRALRGIVLPLTARGSAVASRRAYRGFRLTEAELDRALARAGLAVLSRDESPGSPYRYAREVFLRLGRA